MLMPVAWVEILVGVASEIAKSLYLVLHGMTVNDIHDYSDAILVCCVNEVLKLLRRTESARRGEETAHMIAK